MKHWKNSAWDPREGKAGYKGQRVKKAATPAKKGGRWKCKNCGELGHSAKTRKNLPKQSPPLPKELPDEEIEKIAREERQESVVSL